MYEFPFASKIPGEVTSFVTLIRPFDKFTWIMAIASAIITYFILVLTQKIWSYQSGEPFDHDFLYQGISIVRFIIFPFPLLSVVLYHIMKMNWYHISTQIYALQYF